MNDSYYSTPCLLSWQTAIHFTNQPLKCEAIAHLKPQRHRRLQLKWFGVLNSMSALSMKASTYGYFQVLY